MVLAVLIFSDLDGGRKEGRKEDERRKGEENGERRAKEEEASKVNGRRKVGRKMKVKEGR